MQVQLPFILRQIAGEYVLVPVGASTRAVNGLISVNEIGAFLWEHIPEAADDDALVDLVCDTYEVERDTAAADVGEFLKQLRDLKIL